MGWDASGWTTRRPSGLRVCFCEKKPGWLERDVTSANEGTKGQGEEGGEEEGVKTEIGRECGDNQPRHS